MAYIHWFYFEGWRCWSMQFYGVIFVVEYYCMLLLPEKKLRVYAQHISQKYNYQMHCRDLIIVNSTNARAHIQADI